MQRTQSIWSIRQPVPRGLALGLSFVLPVLVLVAWCVISYGNLAPADFLPSPTEVIRGTLQLFIQYDLTSAILISTRRIVLAFLLAVPLLALDRTPKSLTWFIESGAAAMFRSVASWISPGRKMGDSG